MVRGSHCEAADLGVCPVVQSVSQGYISVFMNGSICQASSTLCPTDAVVADADKCNVTFSLVHRDVEVLTEGLQ